MSKFLVGVLTGLVIVLALGAVIYWRFFLTHPTINNSNNDSNQALTPSPTSTQTATSKKIAYVKDNAIWLINSDGTDKKQLTDQTNAIYPKLSFKNKNELSYIRCTASCQLVTKNLSTNSEIIEIDQPQILAFGWSKTGDKLGYIYKLPTNEMKLDLRTNGNTNTIKNFSEPNIGGGGRGGSLDDDVSVQFSPDDKNILVVNTLTQPNLNDKNTIWVFDIKGQEKLTTPEENGLWPTQAIWNGDDEVIYKIGEVFNLTEIDTKVKKYIFTSANSFNPIKVATDLNIFYWVNNSNGLPTIQYRDDSMVKATTVAEGYYKPQFLNPHAYSPLDRGVIVAIKTKKFEGEAMIIPFVSSGISTINAINEKADLDSGEIGDFTISP